jgi:hypothetical protein
MRHVVVTTARGLVMFGVLKSGTVGGVVALTQARNCVYWGKAVRGVFGLAATGPDDTCRVGPAVPRVLLSEVTSITDCTPDAVEAWERAPWA